ncbi:hypothetical protein KAFR_0E00150 [Kazachstania africana CBS 2517]|uniref:GAG-pre-integrase domain-containing protein n=1 Tax=Kazachstania africana (strain ATCC 22294 / BCRC 22015 / CBS 2517 / CECT 1963 / NBRC 1671 / NRRL Y-8276) TaxID=1071382 RepID=H2AUW9_KAZAF|nr:hypothetical protein KAFR_0E00150 [Kazachstania africana CBS 2517]CCF58169.1 hypothetical protein KAFR_0E00150 [Kazachstania africana CBS 2517]
MHEYDFALHETEPIDKFLPTPVSSVAIRVTIHTRLGHPGLDFFNKSAHQLGSPTLKTGKIPLFPTCTLSRNIIKKGELSNTAYTQPLQLCKLIHAVVSAARLFTSDKFFLTIRDAYSRYYSLIHLKTKGEAAEKFIEWITATENYFSSRGSYRVGAIRTVRTDDAGGFKLNSA